MSDLTERLARVEELLSEQQPDLALVALDEALETHGEDWRLWHLKSAAHRAQGDLRSAVATAEEGLSRYGPKPHLVDLLFVYLARSGRGAEAVARWNDLAPSFDATQNPAANTLAHLVVCFIQAGHRTQGLERLAPLFERARGTSQSREGLMEFNAACLFALEGDADHAAQWAAHALALGYRTGEFDDADFDAVRRAPVFEQLLAHVSDGGRDFQLRQLGARRVFVWTSPNQLRRMDFEDDTLTWDLPIHFDDPYALVARRREWLADLEAEGFARAEFDFTTPWLEALDELFTRLSQVEEPISRLALEWDFLPTAGRIERAYSLTEPLAVHDFGILPLLPTERHLDQVLEAARRLPSHARVRWAPQVIVTHAEHDSGVEFGTSW